MDLRIASIGERPDLAPLLGQFAGSWPEFMYHDPFDALFHPFATTTYADFCLVAVDPADPLVPVAKACSVPWSFGGDLDADLPSGGWDQVLLDVAQDRLTGRPGRLVSALEITIRPDRRGTGLAAVMLDALCRNTVRMGFGDLVAPVRPNGKHQFPKLSMAQYVATVRPDGLPVDPWLRVHVRAGGRIVSVAPRSMVVPGTLAEWRSWTGLPFDATGPVVVPDALTPVHCDVVADHAVYVEPNVWIHHIL